MSDKHCPIDLDKQENVSFFYYPDGQPHIKSVAALPGNSVIVKCTIDSPAKLLLLLELVDVLRHLNTKPVGLFIPYLMGARTDRRFTQTESFDLRVVAMLINLCGFPHVRIFDPHSDVSLALIDRSSAVTNERLVRNYCGDATVLIVPDAGAAKKVHDYQTWNPNLKTVVQCIKERDKKTGEVKLRVLEPGKCKGKSCVIIDDICDGGATFLAIAEQIKPKYLGLIVTHGIFSKGFKELEKAFDFIVTTNSLHQRGKPKTAFFVVEDLWEGQK